MGSEDALLSARFCLFEAFSFRCLLKHPILKWNFFAPAQVKCGREASYESWSIIAHQKRIEWIKIMRQNSFKCFHFSHFFCFYFGVKSNIPLQPRGEPDWCRSVWWEASVQPCWPVMAQTNASKRTGACFGFSLAPTGHWRSRVCVRVWRPG